MSYTVKSIAEAWKKADEIFPTDYIQDEKASARAGYPIYWSTAAGVNAWISDLNSRLEVNLPDGQSINIWIDAPKYPEWAIADALKIADDFLYYVDDQIPDKLADEIGLSEARRIVYATYGKLAKLLAQVNPHSELFDKYVFAE